MDDAKEKKEKTESRLEECGFENIIRFPAVSMESKNLGCNMSHKLLLEEISSKEIYPSLVVEDDIAIKNFRKEIFVPDSADAMFLGISKFGYFPEVNLHRTWARQSLKAADIHDDYHRTYNMLSSHAMLRLNKTYDLACIKQMQKVIDNPRKFITNDVAVAMIHIKYNIYALNDPIFYQDDPRTEKFTNFDFREFNRVVRMR